MKKQVYFLLCGFIILKLAVTGASAYDTKSNEFVGFLSAIEEKCDTYNWKDVNLRQIPWEYHRHTDQKRPLMFATFGDSSRNCTLILGAVHGDELPTVYVLLKLAKYINDNPFMYADKCIVIAPIVNPDGFFAKPAQRFNANKIDINRNFPTRDWYKDALRLWKNRTHSNKRYYPGQQSGSEQETRFQVALIKRFKPQKIVSLHSPLGFYDFDGPSTSLDSFEQWLAVISKETNYPMRKFGIFPGSLGNYAGYERHILTLTLELPSSDPSHGQAFFKKFQPAIVKFVDLSTTHWSKNRKLVKR